MAHKGLREWTGEEVGSLFLGQNGFHVITTGGEIEASGDKDITYWVAIKAIDGTVKLEAQSYGAGDSLSETGAYGGSNWIDMADGDIVYGSFDKITVNTGHVLAYIGR